MALPTGTISMSQINIELGRSATTVISLNDADVRNLAEKLTGDISLDNLRGKSAVFMFNITSDTTNANLRTLAVNAGWNQSFPVEATINSGVTISGNTQSNSTAAMTINGSWPNGVTLINNGVIQGRGGNGGNGCNATAIRTKEDSEASANNTFTTFGGSNGSAGGRALLASVAVSINNNGSIRGGAGGGGGGGSASGRHDTGGKDGTTDNHASSGGGGGGGQSSQVSSSGGTKGTVNSDGTSTVGGNGGAGTISSAGSGGARPANAAGSGGTVRGGAGGGGGGFGSSGVKGQDGIVSVDDGAIGDNTFESSKTGRLGGAAGQAISGNSNITWLETGTRIGPIV